MILNVFYIPNNLSECNRNNLMNVRMNREKDDISAILFFFKSLQKSRIFIEIFILFSFTSG